MSSDAGEGRLFGQGLSDTFRRGPRTRLVRALREHRRGPRRRQFGGGIGRGFSRSSLSVPGPASFISASLRRTPRIDLPAVVESMSCAVVLTIVLSSSICFALVTDQLLEFAGLQLLGGYRASRRCTKRCSLADRSLPTVASHVGQALGSDDHQRATTPISMKLGKADVEHDGGSAWLAEKRDRCERDERVRASGEDLLGRSSLSAQRRSGRQSCAPPSLSATTPACRPPAATGRRPRPWSRPRRSLTASLNPLTAPPPPAEVARRGSSGAWRRRSARR